MRTYQIIHWTAFNDQCTFAHGRTIYDAKRYLRDKKAQLDAIIALNPNENLETNLYGKGHFLEYHADGVKDEMWGIYPE